MKYLCIVCLDKNLHARTTPEEWAAVGRDSLRYDEDLESSGHYIHAEALQSTDTAVTVRVRDGNVSTTDGPFIETKEHIAGFILIEARDLNEAIDKAAGIPLAKYGAVEVRPVMTFG